MKAETLPCSHHAHCLPDIGAEPGRWWSLGTCVLDGCHVDSPVQINVHTVPASILKLFVNETWFFQGNDIVRLA